MGYDDHRSVLTISPRSSTTVDHGPGFGRRDDRQTRELLVHALETWGFDVVTATDGHQAVARFEQHQDQLDVVVLDLMMPKLDGLGVTRWIRRRQHSHLPILHATAMSGHAQTLRGLAAGADDYIVKPSGCRRFEPETVVRSRRSERRCRQTTLPCVARYRKRKACS